MNHLNLKKSNQNQNLQTYFPNMTKPNQTQILILFMLLVIIPSIVAGTESSPPPTPFQQMVDFLLVSVPPGDDSAELNWTIRARNNSDTNVPAPKNVTELRRQEVRAPSLYARQKQYGADGVMYENAEVCNPAHTPWLWRHTLGHK